MRNPQWLALIPLVLALVLALVEPYLTKESDHDRH
jgi:hypothetical protein